ncbi:MAG: acetolactate synthase large subunit [SAR86 cluster bacterium]|jgi:acetolactate synthase-1/2/3 large subunit|nr:acetolactate synthase large subunit [SAR86 cluster bacterium]
MNAADALLKTLVDNGLEVVFANPGTSEMHLVAAIDHYPQIRPVLGLFEGVVTGAADGYARMSGKAAANLLHLGPGLGNGFANIHNAKKARSPMINIVGDHATFHLKYDAPLTSDLDGLAKSSSDWVERVKSPEELPAGGSRAWQAAHNFPGQIATLIVPADCAWGETDKIGKILNSVGPSEIDNDVLREAYEALTDKSNCMLFLGGEFLDEQSVNMAAKIATKTGARLATETFRKRQRRGFGIPVVEPLPYFSEMAEDFLDGIESIVFVGSKPPVSFFAYPDKRSYLSPENSKLVQLATFEQDGKKALESLCEMLDANEISEELLPSETSQAPLNGELNPAHVGLLLGELLPEEAIVSDEAATSGFLVYPNTWNSKPHDWLSLTGGSIGQGLPLATGAAIACPDRPVICLHGDGGAMYTIQSLWTQARENLNVTNIIFSNRAYAILKIELDRVGALETGDRAESLFSLENPEINWISLGKSLGVESFTAPTVEEFRKIFSSAVNEPGPSLIEVRV